MGLSIMGLFGAEILGDVQLLVQTILYFVIALFGMMSAIPVGVTSNKFDGGCLLYAKVHVLTNTPDVPRFTINYGSKSSCEYIIAIHVLFSVLYGLGMGVLHAVVIVKRMRQGDIGIVKTFTFNTVVLGVNSFIALLCFIAACVTAVGFKKWCNELLESYPDQDGCSDFQDWVKWDKRDGSSFHKSFSLAATCCWLATLSWVFQACLNGLTFYKQTEGKSRRKSPASTAASTPTSGVSTLARF